MVDTSMLDSMLSLNERMVTLYAVTGHEPKRGKFEHLWPRGAFQCSDGYVAINIPDDIMWQRVAKTIGRPDLCDDPRSISGTARAANADFLQPIVEGWMAGKTRAKVVDALNTAGVPAGPVYTAKDVFEDDHFRKRDMLVEINDPEVGPATFARTTPHLSAAPRIPTEPAPNLGQHTRYVLPDLLGYSSDAVVGLVAEGVVAVNE